MSKIISKSMTTQIRNTCLDDLKSKVLRSVLRAYCVWANTHINVTCNRSEYEEPFGTTLQKTEFQQKTISLPKHLDFMIYLQFVLVYI